MKKIILFSIIFSLFLDLNINANEVNIKDAKNIAKNFWFQKSDISYNEISFSNEFIISEGSVPVYYIFNLSNEIGFVIISAEDKVIPVLGYSFEGDYSEENQPPQFISWMQNYKEQILFVRENNLETTDEIKSQWEKYSKVSEKGNNYFNNRAVVGPLLSDIAWNQGCMYNDSCPVDAAGPCGHVYAGCVATATGMIMKYHTHPHTGTGSHSYTHPTYGTLSANFGATTYDWANMPSSGSNGNVTQLLYHVGVSVDMNYGPYGSGAYTSHAVTALINYFSYNPAAYYAQKASYTPSIWDNMLMTELNNNRPLLYRGQGTGGHAFVCDGYDDNHKGSLFFHFNWGWGGAYNGYFQLTSLYPVAGHNYTNDQAAGFGIQPTTTSAPNSDFYSDFTCPCVGNTVNFYDQSTDGPNSWSWSFQGGTPTSSTNENPSIVYNTAGFYDVSLTASNVSGAGNTETKSNYISVYNTPTTAICYPSTQTMGNYWYGVLNVTLNDLNHSSGDTYADGGCMDFICKHSTTLTPGSTYNLDITVRVGNSGSAHTYVYIDFNNNGDLSDAGECIVNNEISSTPLSSNTFTKSITMPSNPTMNQLLRMRVVTDVNTVSGPCSNPYIGQSEDYGVYFISELVWSGNSDSDWNTATNWSGNAVPTSSDNVIIPNVTNDPIINESPGTPATCYDLTLQSDATLTINAGKALTMDGDLSIASSKGAATITINSDASGTGSLIVKSTPTGNLSMQRYIVGHGGSSTAGWHLLASPVATFSINGSSFDPGTSDDLYRWEESTGLWMNHKAGDPTQIVSGTGYLVAYNTTGIKTFTGTVNNSDITCSNLSYTPTANSYSWHLLGNPFPSALLWDATSWSRSNVNAVAKIWNENSASYTDILQNGAIPATQGFMISVSSASNSITIPLADRTHNTQNWYKDEEINKIKLTAYDPEGNTAQESIIKFNENATTEFDSEYDSHFLAGYAPLFYSLSDDVKLSTNTLPEINEELSIPFDFIKNTSTNFYIETEGIENLYPDYPVYLTDLKTGNTQNLTDNPVYSFTASEGDDAQRFLLHFKAVGIDEQNQTSSNIQIWSSNKKINILNPEHQKGTIRILNMYGQILFETQLNGNDRQEISINVTIGNYIVNVISDKGVISKKVFMRN